MGKDWSWPRVIAGIVCGEFAAFYFTDIVMGYMPMDSLIDPSKAYAAVAGTLGATGYALVSRMIEYVQTGQFPINFYKGKE